MQKKIIFEVHELVEELSKPKYKIIGLEGESQTGKTPFSQELVDRLGHGSKAIHLDHYIKMRNANYSNSLDLEKLKNEIKLHKNKVVIIEGIVLRKILNELDINLDISIFIYTNLSNKKTWERYFEEEVSLNKIVKEHEDLINKTRKAEFLTPNYKIDDFEKSLYEYFLDYKPQLKSDIIYINNYKEKSLLE